MVIENLTLENKGYSNVPTGRGLALVSKIMLKSPQ